MRLRNGLEEFVAAEGEPFGSSYASVLWGRLEPGTRLGYVAALRQFLRYSRVHGWFSPREALEGRLLEIARDGYFEGQESIVPSQDGGESRCHTVPGTRIGLDFRKIPAKTATEKEQ